MTGLYGPIIFGTGYGGNDFQDMRKTVSARWLPHEVHASKPLLEYGGPQLIELDFRMKWCMPISGDPTQAVFILQEIMDLAIPLPLILGSMPMGRGSSLFVMTDLTWSPNYFIRGGVMIAADADIKLKEYVDTIGPSSLLSALGGIGGMVGGIGGAVSGALGAVSGITSAVSGFTGAISNVSGMFQGAVSSINGIAANVVAGPLPTALSSVERLASTVVNNPIGGAVKGITNIMHG